MSKFHREREAEMNARWEAEKLARLASMSESELIRRLRDEEFQSGYRANHWSAGPTGMYRQEIERRRTTGALEAPVVAAIAA